MFDSTAKFYRTIALDRTSTPACAGKLPFARRKPYWMLDFLRVAIQYARAGEFTAEGVD